MSSFARLLAVLVLLTAYIYALAWVAVRAMP